MKLLKRVVIIESIMLFVLIPFTVMLYFKYEETKLIVRKSTNYAIWFLDNIYNKIYLICEELKIIYPNISDVFTNRELAIGFLALLVVIIFSFNKSTRRSFIDIIKILFSKQFMKLNFIMLIYTMIISVLLAWIDFWELALLKSTIIWFFTVGIISVYKAINSAKDYKYFLSVIKDNIGFILIIEFVTNLYSFAFIKEVALIVLILFISLLVAIIEVKPEFSGKEYKRMKNIFYMMIIGISIYWLYNSVKLLVDDMQNINVAILIKELVLPSIYSTLFVIVMYFIVIYSMYEVMFIRIGFKKIIDDEFRTYLKLRILMFCNLNIIRINNFVERSGVLTSYINSKQDVKQIIKKYKA